MLEARHGDEIRMLRAELDNLSRHVTAIQYVLDGMLQRAPVSWDYMVKSMCEAEEREAAGIQES